MDQLSPISNIIFGKADGKNEARNPKFESLFYDGGGYYNELKTDPLKSLVIGRKGTGKTILVRYFESKLNKNKHVYTKFIVAGDFTDVKLKNFDYTKVKEEEREIFWRYVILKELTLLVKKNEKGFLSKKYTSKLRDLDDNLSLSLDEIIQENNAGIKISANSKGAGAGFNAGEHNTSTYRPSMYFTKIDELTETLMQVMERAKNQYYLFFDDLDEIKLSSIQAVDGENNVTVLAKLLNDFVNALSYINDKLLDVRCGSRIISTLRKDVADQMQLYGNNINKVVTDNGISINWYSTLIKSNPQNSELGKLILHKIRASIPDYSNIEDRYLFDKIFVNSRKKNNPFKYIVDRGFGRPRDVIQYLDLVQQDFPNATTISYENVRQVQAKYCSWFFSELQNEINILENSHSIIKTIELIKKQGLVTYTYQQLFDFLDENREEFYEISNLKQDLKSLFRLGAIGNHEKKEGKHPIIEFSYRDGIDNPDFSKKFVVHKALRNYLSIN